MTAFLFRWLAIAVGVYVAVTIVPGVHVSSVGVLALAALAIGFANAVVRPIIAILALPITILTLGLFYLVVNGLAFWLAAGLVPGFTVASLGSAITGAFVVSVVSWVLELLLAPARHAQS